LHCWNAADVSDAASGDNAFFYCSCCSVLSVVDAVFNFFGFYFCAGANADDCYAAG
jgi:predicted RNA-binding protein with PUA-like domain